MASVLPSGVGPARSLPGRRVVTRPAWRALLALGAFILSTSPLAAQTGWSLLVGGERSAVSNAGTDTTWSTEALTVGFVRETAGGWRASVERQARGTADDTVVTTGGYRRLGDWTIGASASGSPSPTFWFRRAVDAELSRRVVGTVVASAAYRYMDFPSAAVHQLQPALTWYNPRGEVQARLYVTRNATRDRTSLAMLLRGDVRLDARFSVAAAFASGDRIFDIASLAYGTARSWMGRGSLRVRVSRRNEVEVGGGYAREAPVFRQRTIALSYRRVF